MTDAKKTPAAAPRLAQEGLEEDGPPAEAPPAYSPPSKHPLNPQVPLSQQLQVAAGPSRSVNRQFPPEFNLYSASVLGKSYHLGEHQNSPIYIVTTHTGWSGNPDVVLHTSTDSNSPPLATANFKTFSHDTTIVLPPLSGRAPAAETVMSGSAFSRTFSFSVEVPASAGGQLRSEPFEWRHSKGEDVGKLGSVWGSGWKLVRTAGQGKEIVAVFTLGTISLTKKFCFRFLGAGESGALGERWAVMAVITAMAIWEKDRRSKNHGT